MLELREQWLLEQDAVRTYKKFPFYPAPAFRHPDFNPDESRAFDLAQAGEMRDPLNVTSQYPLPDGSFFCPPVPQDGAIPYRDLPAASNAFDFSHLEMSAATPDVVLPPPMPPAPQSAEVPPSKAAVTAGLMDAVTPAAPRSTSAYTPSHGATNAGYDTYAYLQGAQKVLEGLQRQNPGQQRLSIPQQCEEAEAATAAKEGGAGGGEGK